MGPDGEGGRARAGEGGARMTDQELIHELEKAANRWEKENPIIGVGKLRYCDALRDAACRIAALQAENAELCAQHRTEYCEAAGYDCAELGRLRAVLSRVEAERDALLEYAETQMECEMCKNDVFCPIANPMSENCAVCELKPKCPCHPCKWEWRGAQGVGRA